MNYRIYFSLAERASVYLRRYLWANTSFRLVAIIATLTSQTTMIGRSLLMCYASICLLDRSAQRGTASRKRLFDDGVSSMLTQKGGGYRVTRGMRLLPSMRKPLQCGIVAAAFILSSVSALAQTSISGTFKYPDTTALTGKVMISLSRPVINTCVASQIIRFKPIVITITAGSLGSLTLMPTPCTSPVTPYTVVVYDSLNQILYRGHWTVPNSGSADVTQLGEN